MPAKILIVDDEPSARMILQALLFSEGYTLQFATNGVEGLEQAHAWQPDVILSDVMMPAMDGFEFCRHIRADARLSQVPIILVTALDDRQAKLDGLQAGADDFLSKPIDPLELRMRLRTLTQLDRFRKLNEERAQLEQTHRELLQTYAALHASEEQYHLLFQTMVQGVVVQDAAGCIIHANPAAERILGLAFDQMQGRTLLDPCWKFVQEDGSDFPGETHPAMRSLRTGQPVYNQVMGVFNPALESYGWININIVPQFKKGEAQPYQVYTTLEDITERKRAEHAVRRYSEQLTQVVEIEYCLAVSLDRAKIYEALRTGILRLFPDITAFFISGFDAERRMIQALYAFSDGETLDVAHLPEIPLAPDGQGIQSQVIYTRQPVIISDSLKKRSRPGVTVRVGSEDRDAQSALLVPMLVHDKVLGIIQLQSYTPKRFTAEDTRLLALVANTAAASIQNAQLYETAQQEIAERQHAEQSLRASEERYRSTLDGMLEGCQIVSPDGHYLYVNPTAAWQGRYTREELLGHTMMEMYPGIEKTAMFAHLVQCMNDRTPHRMDNEFVYPDGTTGWFELSIQPVPEGIFILSLDITERKCAEEEREKLVALVESSPNLIGLASLDGQVQYLNYGGRQLIGLPSAAPLCIRIDEFAPMGSSSFAEAMQALKQQGQWQGEGELLNLQTRAIIPTQIQVFLIHHPQTHQPIALGAVMQDITERKAHEAEVAWLFAAEQARRQELDALYNLANALVGTDSLDHTLDLIVRTAVATTHVTFARLALFENGRFVIRAAHPIRVLDADLFAACPPSIVQHDLCDQVFAQTEPTIVHADDATLMPEDRQTLFLGVARSVCLVPLRRGNQATGILLLAEVRAREREPFTAEKRKLARAIGDQAASAIRRALLHKQTLNDALELENAYEATIEGWSHALDLRDNETEGHTQRVTELTLELARAFGFTDEQLVHVRRGALLHDIGKMGVPDAILLKPGALNEQEWEIMRRHPEYAKMLLLPIHYLKPALDIPYCHHEKWDGTGYPRGLKGEEIPLVARLFAVIDVWDAMTSNRPYRLGLPKAHVLEWIRANRGTHFDPKVVEVFHHVIQSR